MLALGHLQIFANNKTYLIIVEYKNARPENYTLFEKRRGFRTEGLERGYIYIYMLHVITADKIREQTIRKIIRFCILYM